MPKSRRVKTVALTKTKEKGRDHKDALIDKVREAFDAYPHVFTFSVQNDRSELWRNVREARKDDSRFFMGNNKVMQVALGRDAESSHKDNVHKLCRYLTGHSGLLFTSLPKKQIKDFFKNSVGDAVFARPGTEATVDFSIPQGPLEQFPHSMFDQLTKLGLPIKLDKGVLVVLNDVKVCSVGDTLSTEQAHVLKVFGVMSAKFEINLTGHWTDGVAKAIGE